MTLIATQHPTRFSLNLFLPFILKEISTSQHFHVFHHTTIVRNSSLITIKYYLQKHLPCKMHFLLSLLLLSHVHPHTNTSIPLLYSNDILISQNLVDSDVIYNLYTTSTIDTHSYSKTTLSFSALSSAHTSPSDNLVLSTNNIHINNYLYAGNILSTCTKGQILIDIINLSASPQTMPKNHSSPLLIPYS